MRDDYNDDGLLNNSINSPILGALLCSCCKKTCNNVIINN